MDGHTKLDVDHFVGYLGLRMWHEDGERTLARATIRPEMWAPGTRRVRLGLLFTMADVVGGSPPSGGLTPTVDLRLQLLTAAPSEGDIVVEARPLKVGRRLWTGEVVFTAEGHSDVFARGEYSFMNERFADALAIGPRGPGRGSDRRLPVASFDELFQMRMLGDGATEMDPHEAVRNGVVGTIQGGAQAAMAEVTAERALSDRGRFAVCDLHLRYLSALKVGPAVARPRLLPGDAGRPVVQVSITDRGAGGRLVSAAVAVCQPDPD
jgi:acyl-coenzyme A thioesterase PaaI-like protein